MPSLRNVIVATIFVNASVTAQAMRPMTKSFKECLNYLFPERRVLDDHSRTFIPVHSSEVNAAVMFVDPASGRPQVTLRYNKNIDVGQVVAVRFEHDARRLFVINAEGMIFTAHFDDLYRGGDVHQELSLYDYLPPALKTRNRGQSVNSISQVTVLTGGTKLQIEFAHDHEPGTYSLGIFDLSSRRWVPQPNGDSPQK